MNELQLDAAGWEFDDPQLTEPTELTMRGRRVWGHLVRWDQVPRRYDLADSVGDAFHRLEVVLSSGQVLRVGTVSASGGHADPRMPSPGDFYDGEAPWAYVRGGDDPHGLWVAGVLADPPRFVSGDWRRREGRMRLVGALMVTRPPGLGVNA